MRCSGVYRHDLSQLSTTFTDHRTWPSETMLVQRNGNTALVDRRRGVHCVRTHPQISKMCKIKSKSSISFVSFCGERSTFCKTPPISCPYKKTPPISFPAYGPALYNARKSRKMLVRSVITFIKREKFAVLNHNSPNIHTTKVTFENIFFYLSDAILAIIPST